jgi:hypothetical protein
MTEQAGTRGISIGGSASGQLNTGDNSTQLVQHGMDGDALRTFVTLMRQALVDVDLTEDEEAELGDSLAEIGQVAETQQPDEGRLRAAFGRLAAFLAEAGQPALTAVFMTLAFHLGVAR